MVGAFEPDFLEVFVVEGVGLVNEIAVEALLGRLVAADKKDSGTPRVESIEDANGRACGDPEFTHVRVTRGLHRGRVGKGRRTPLRMRTSTELDVAR